MRPPVASHRPIHRGAGVFFFQKMRDHCHSRPEGVSNPCDAPMGSRPEHDTSMQTELVLKAATTTLNGTLPFPEIVRLLLEAGVESYHVDYIGLRKTFFSTTGETMVTALTCEGLPPVGPHFDAAALRAAILDSQQHGQKFRDFTRRAMEAGVAGYIAFLHGKRVTYFGRLGDQHTEWFPGAGPTPSSRLASGATGDDRR